MDLGLFAIVLTEFVFVQVIFVVFCLWVCVIFFSFVNFIVIHWLNCPCLVLGLLYIPMPVKSGVDYVRFD